MTIDKAETILHKKGIVCSISKFSEGYYLHVYGRNKELVRPVEKLGPYKTVTGLVDCEGLNGR